MQAWRSRLLPTYPPLNRSNSQTQPWPILIQAPRLPGDSVRRRGRGLAGGAVHQRKPQRWLQSPTSRCWPTLGALRRRAALAASGEDPLILGLGGGNSRLETFPEMSAPGDFREALETRQEGISTRPPFALSVSRGESHEERQKCGEEGRSQVHSNASSWPSPRGQRQGRALLGEKR